MSQPAATPNRLIHETSPYLLQHAYNPVDWYPWGPDALEKARTENKPILLSIGYSACHWCHVMERESFQDPTIAAFMNEHFVNIKVDREERPDLDEIYQTAAQLLSGQGGWPLTVFLTPDQRPFYAGTYFPPDDRYGRPGFLNVMQMLIRLLQQEPHRVYKSADQLTRAIRQVDRRDVDRRAPIRPEQGEALLTKAVQWLEHYFDDEYGGFGTRPKFPNPSALELFLRHAARTGNRPYWDMAVKALTAMAQGGIYDHLGGGFHRYSTDERWLVPHFEKMLYDNALLPPVYLQAMQLGTRMGLPDGSDGSSSRDMPGTTNRSDPRAVSQLAALYERVVRETLAYVDREMSHPGGGFYSSQDADSEGEEGKFFVWRPDEIEDVVGQEAALLFCDAYGVTPQGNFEKGTSVLHAAMSLEALADKHGLSADEAARRLEEARHLLFQARERRVKPGTDEKVITGWNALMISAFALAARVLDDENYAGRAQRAVRFIEEHLVQGDRLLRSFKEKPSPIPGYLEDYAFWVKALLDLYETTLDRWYLDRAGDWMERALELFWDDETPGFFLTPKDHEKLIHRPKAWRDQSIPSGTGISVQNLLRLHAAFDQRGYEERARAVLDVYERQLDQNPWGTASLVIAYDGLVHGATEVVLVADEAGRKAVAPFRRVIGRRYLPHGIVHLIGPEEAEKDDAPLLWRGKRGKEESVVAYVCRCQSCSPPVDDPAALERLLSGTGPWGAAGK